MSFGDLISPVLNLNDMLFSLETICRDCAQLCENVIKSLAHNLANFKLLNHLVHLFSLVKVQLLMFQNILREHVQIRLRHSKLFFEV